MKRFLTYCILAVALFTGVMGISMSKSESVNPVIMTSGHQQPSPEQHQSFFAAADLCLYAGINNEQIRLSHSMQNVSYRIYPSLLNGFRTNHSTQLADQKIFTGTIVFILSSAKKQLDGYYLYHLCKLLI